MGKQVCAKHNEAYETECRWCAPLPPPLEIPIWTGEIKQVHPLEIKQAPVAPDASELQRLMNEAWVKMARIEKDAKLMNEAWVKMARIEKDAKAAAVLMPSLTVECYPGCPLCRKENP